MYGAKSPDRCRSNETYAVPRLADDGTTRPTYEPFATARMLALSSVQFWPPSVDTWTLPSSVPTHSTLGSIGDSPIAVISLKLDSPSLRESRMLRSSTPPSISVSRLIERVRSFVAVQVLPK